MDSKYTIKAVSYEMNHKWEIITYIGKKSIIK